MSIRRIFFSTPLIVLLWLTVLLSSFVFTNASYTVTIPKSGDRECFWIRVPQDRHSTISGNFDCWSDHENMLAAAWIEKDTDSSENSVVWHSRPGAHEELFEIDIPKGGGKTSGSRRYTICFESQMATTQEKLQSMKRKQQQQQKQQARQAQQKNELADEMEPAILVEEDVIVEEPVTVGFNIRVSSAVPRTLPDNEMGPDALRAVALMDSAASIERHWENLIDHFDFLRNREAIHAQLTSQINDRVMGWSIIEAVVVVTMAIGQVWYWKKFFEQRRYL